MSRWTEFALFLLVNLSMRETNALAEERCLWDSDLWESATLGASQQVPSASEADILTEIDEKRKAIEIQIIDFIDLTTVDLHQDNSMIFFGKYSNNVPMS